MAGAVAVQQGEGFHGFLDLGWGRRTRTGPYDDGRLVEAAAVVGYARVGVAAGSAGHHISRASMA
ncbi:hypothetical protein Asp14428_22420 [Actinoplanes sp. NBRC 14428]|nr:hypothetical protein Asp14428_22420 [Actinoplanes sp. NBRC 14428]